MTQKIRWGIVGSGVVAALFAEGLARVPGAELVAVASRSKARADDLAGRFGARRSYDSYEAIAQDRDVDIVYIATPNVDHRARALMMLDAGKPLLCEKPFMLDAAESREVVDRARERGLFCMEAMWMRFLPAIVELVDRVRSGAFGQPRSTTIELGHPFEFDASHRLFDRAAGGGALLDLGVYAVSFAVMLFGAPVSVQGQASLAPSGVDEHVTALLGHAGGEHSLVAASLRVKLANTATIACTRAWARLDEPLYRPDGYSVTPAPAASLAHPVGGLRSRARQIALLRALRRRVLAMAPAALRRGGRHARRPFDGNGYGHEAAEAMRCLRAGEKESRLMPLDETLRVMQTLDAIRNGWKVV